MISYGKQWIDDEDIEAVVSTLKSDFLTQGPAVEKIEQSIRDYTGARYCVAVANGTAALHLAVAALDLEPSKEGITSPVTFVASSNALVYNQLKPVFADIDSKTYNVTPESIKEKITENTAVFIPVHLAGQPCRVKEIKELADQKNIRVIEDAAHAIGSSYEDGDRVGSCRYSDMTIFSFHPVKTVTTGEGGAVTTNSRELYEKLLLLRSHGITKKSDFLKQNPGPWYYEMQTLGFNYRMCDLQAALGVSQMKKLDMFKARRRELVDRYHRLLKDISGITQPYEEEGLESCFHLYIVQIDFEKIGINRAQLMQELFQKGVGTQVHYIPVNSQPYYREQWGCDPSDTPRAWDYYQKALSLPLYPGMTDQDQDLVVEALCGLL